MENCDVIVVGGGHNGLVSAAYLAQAGYRVAVLEKHSIIGGCCCTEAAIPELPDFRFNIGGIHHIHVLGSPVLQELNLAAHGLKYLYHDPLWFFPYPDGKSLTIYKSIERTCEEVARIAPEDAEAYRAFHAFWERVLKVLEPMELGPPPPFGALGEAAGGLPEAEALIQTLLTAPRKFVEQWFQSPYLQGVMGWWSVQTGTPPDQPGSTLAAALLTSTHLLGMARPEGGSGALCEALVRLIRSSGGTVTCDAEVTEILVEGGRAAGVIVNGHDRIDCRRAVISAIDAKRVFLRLVKPEHVPTEVLQTVRKIGTGNVALLKVDLALSELPVFEAYGGRPEQTLATPTIAPSMEYVAAAFDDIMHGRPSGAPALWCVVASHLDPTLAPPGKHTLWLSQFAPYALSDGRTWDEAKEEVADRMVETFARYAPNTSRAILGRHITSPLDWERRTGNIHGNAFHVDMSVDQMMGFRPAPSLSRYRTPIQGLYLTGSGTHPGGGITGVPGRNTAQVVLQDLRGRRRGVGVDRLRGMWRAYRALRGTGAF